VNRIKEILERKAEINAILKDEKRSKEVNFKDLEKEVRELNEELEELQTRERLVKETEQLNKGGKEARTIETFNAGNRQEEERGEEVNWEQRGEDLFEKRAVTVASGDLVTPSHTKADIKGTFNQVSTLLDRVTTTPLEGGESYEAPFEISHGEGNYTAEGTPYFDVTQEFGYAAINKTKITAYNEITEEVLKLPRADYATRTVEGVRKSLRKKITKEILTGSGAAGEFTGIFSANATAINPATDIEISSIDADTLDDIIYAYGGDEDVEDAAVLVLSKDDLRQFALVKDGNGRKYYDVVNSGNTGTINGVPYVINSAAGSLATALDGEYLMAYGPLSNYEVAVFSPTDIKRSEDVKFKEGMIAHRGSVFAGGNVVAQNGFLRVKKAPTV
jgi:HK97 family phage major capsid protein